MRIQQQSREVRPSPETHINMVIRTGRLSNGGAFRNPDDEPRHWPYERATDRRGASAWRTTTRAKHLVNFVALIAMCSGERWMLGVLREEKKTNTMGSKTFFSIYGNWTLGPTLGSIEIREHFSHIWKERASTT